MSYDKALSTFEGRPDPDLFEEGAADGKPAGSPLPRFEKSFKSWPIARAKATAWYLARQQAAREAVDPGKTKARSYRARPNALPKTTFTGPGSIWAANPAYNWKQIPAGTGLGWITPPLKKTVVGRRHRLGRPVGAHLRRPQHRPRGHPHRGAAQRPGGLCAVGLAARQPPQARQGQVDADLAGAHQP